ncbi:restriction endonuclease [Brevundimonas sp.]|uniref:restriction endonuclease n=1 Tax=Brevundimonas sp. TaxID=1871086 RepID=UPI0028B1F496|nr:restriction endonuclease [Brevundimonas sp.]
MKGIEDLVQDWGGFECLIAQLHDTGSVTVQHNVTLQGRSGASRQIDVLVHHREGLYDHRVVVECKYRKRPVTRAHVDELIATVREVGASRGVIFSTKGFQSGAIAQAAHAGISLFKIREPTDAEWGLPGRHIDLWLQTISIGVGELRFPGSMAVGALPESANLELRIGFDGPGTPIVVPGLDVNTLEQLIERLARESARSAYEARRIDFGGGVFTGVHRARFQVNFTPKTPVERPHVGGKLLFPRIEFDVGLRIDQGRIQIDRAERYAFVLAVEDCVTKVVQTASRAENEGRTVIHERDNETPEPGEALQNGTIAVMWLKGFAEFAEFASLPKADGPGKSLSIKSDLSAAASTK